jgi:hypothetical protein
MTWRDGIVGLILPRCHQRGHPQLTVLVYRRDTAGRKRPTAEDAMTARRMLLGGLARGTGIFELPDGLAALHPRNDTFPGEVFLRLAADALEWCGAGAARGGRSRRDRAGPA